MKVIEKIQREYECEFCHRPYKTEALALAC